MSCAATIISKPSPGVLMTEMYREDIEYLKEWKFEMKNGHNRSSGCVASCFLEWSCTEFFSYM